MPKFPVVADPDGYAPRLYTIRTRALVAKKLTLHQATKPKFTLAKNEKLTDQLFRQLYLYRFNEMRSKRMRCSWAVVQRKTEDILCRDLFGELLRGLPKSELGKILMN